MTVRPPERSRPPRRARATLLSLGSALALVVGSLVAPAVVASASSSRASTPQFAVSHPLSAATWLRLAVAHNTVVALSTSGRLATSRDGLSWRNLATPLGEWNTLSYGAGRFVALSARGAGLAEMTSVDGVHWRALRAPTGPWTGLAYGDGQFVAVSRAGQFMTSTDGLHWTVTWVRSQFAVTALAFGAGRFIAVDAHDGDVLISVNGVNWSFYPIATPGTPWTSVTYVNGVFVALSPRGLSATTMLGYTWVTHPAPRGLSAPRASGGCSTVVGEESTTSGPSVLRSQLGERWAVSPIHLALTGHWVDVAALSQSVVLLSSSGEIATWRIPGYCGPSLPSPPRDVSGNLESGQVWTYQHPSLQPGGAPVDRYLVTVTSAGHSLSCPAAVNYEPHCLIQGLTNGRLYTLTTRAHNRFGYSAPSDPEWIVPVAHWSLWAWSPVSTVATGHPLTVYVTGIIANAEGIYPQSQVIVHVGSTALGCVPSPFGECRWEITAPAPGRLSLWASYSGYGVTYQSPVRVVTVTP